MNRSIQFIAWTGKSFIKWPFYFDESQNGEYFVCDDLRRDNWIKVNHLLQFTGLKDKNEIDIYEGHIVKDTGNFNKKPNIRKVVFVPELASFALRETNDLRSYSFNANNKGICDHLEIIGNIFENPELMQ